MLNKKIFIVLGLLALFLSGLGMRRAVLSAQFTFMNQAYLPFTLESALNFRRVQEVFLHGTLPKVDQAIQYPGGIVVRETDTVGAEYVYAALARLFPRSLSLADRLRWIEPAWFCLGIPLMAFWLWWWRRSVTGSIVAAGFYAVALSSVIRSTGQEISHENFALPLLIGHFAFWALSDSARGRRGRFLAMVLSALLLGAALIAWDMVQFYILIWMVYQAGRWLVRQDELTSRDTSKWFYCWVVLVLLGAINPYLRAHAFLLSPAMALSYGLILAWIVRRLSGRRHTWICGGLILLPVLLLWLLPSSYHVSYSHFAHLLWAKIRFLNQKPADPARLDFDQRIMWVPALHSANWALTKTLFPAMLPLVLLAAIFATIRADIRSDSRIIQLLFFNVISFLAYVLFVRFHVFCALFAAGLLGVWASWAASRRNVWSGLIPVILAAGIMAESIHVLYKPERWGRTWVYYQELNDLVQWMGQYVAPEPVLANFGVSASILTYGKCPIILHPKFEAKIIRDRVQAYGERLFKGTEKEFRDWAEGQGAQYYVYSMGEFAHVAPEQQMRYFVNALNPPAQCPARLFESSNETAENFKFLWGNRKYRVFKIVTPRDKEVVGRFDRAAEQAFEQGQLQRAEDKALAALLIEPDDADALAIIQHVGSLRNQGFRETTDEEK